VRLYPVTPEVVAQFEAVADAAARAGGAGLAALLARARATATLKFSYMAGRTQRGGLAVELARLASLPPAQQRAECEALPAELRPYLSLEQAATPPWAGREAREGAPGTGVRPGASGVSVAELAEALSSHAHARRNRLDLQFTAKVQVDLLKGPTGARPWPASSSRPRSTSTRSG
jgi:hypothetical protein